MIGNIYFVGTPIGNLDDITIRAINTLKSVDIIACEDTRHSSILLNHLGIHAKTISYHKFNEKQMTDKIITMLKNGQNIAIISDAGMPGISDPGFVLLKELILQNINYEIIPGVTAVTTAEVGACLGDGKFCFVGFLPPKKIDKDKLLTQYLGVESTLIFYSATHDINNDLEYLFQVLGSKPVSIANELTKKFEKYYHGTLGEIQILEPRGEYVVLVQNLPNESPLNDLSIQEHLQYYINAGESRMNAIKMVARDRNLKKNQIYNELNKK